MEKRKYEPSGIESKWQTRWENREVFKANIDHSQPKYYILDMFPYPSGSGLHVGHVTGYTATDILARYKRQKGHNVLHPMGWDSFGLPAEQYAIRTGTHPKITTEQNIATFRRQLKSLGLSYDWSREIATSNPDYYKWTQWIFTKLYERGLAYEAEILVNFCPMLGTVLANEEVEDGKSKEGGFPIERRPLRQWILKITEYADRLIEDLSLVDWPEHLKKLQINWIGKSEGAKIHFVEKESQETISVFTTCAHTLFGVSYLVLAPEHPLVEKIVQEVQRKEVSLYKQSVTGKSDLERTDLAKDKTGVWTGAYAINPINGKLIPIWIADYVLASYGTGAVMGVPAHDERDFAFAKLFDLPIFPVIDPDTKQDPDLIFEGLDEKDIQIEVLSGRRCWIREGTLINSQSKELSLNGVSVEKAKQLVIEWLEKNGRGERCVNYKLRDWLFSRQRYWGEPMPIIHFADGSKRALQLDELPLIPPELTDYKPSESGDSPLAKVREWVEITDPKTGRKGVRETNTMPQWAGSCWYYLRFCDPHNKKEAWSQEAEKYWMPVDLYVGGIEHAVLHLLYARFWHKVLYDCQLVSGKEPFQTLRNQGLVVARSYQRPGGGYVSPDEVKEENGRWFQKGTNDELCSQIDKMSKSKLNGVSPDELVQEYGADALRLYAMFMGPFDREKVWNTDAVTGCKRFLNRFYDLIVSEKVTEEERVDGMRLIHKLLFAVEQDLEGMQFNTAIAKMMECINRFAPLSQYPKSALILFTQMLYPFAPHVASEAWELLGRSDEIAYATWPSVDPKFLIEDRVTYVVQVNGKVRGRWELAKDLSEQELFDFVKKQEEVGRYLQGSIEKIVYVPNKLLSLVVK